MKHLSLRIFLVSAILLIAGCATCLKILGKEGKCLFNSILLILYNTNKKFLIKF